MRSSIVCSSCLVVSLWLSSASAKTSTPLAADTPVGKFTLGGYLEANYSYSAGFERRSGGVSARRRAGEAR